MKKILTLSLLALAVVAGATPVMFPLSAMFGGGAYNKPFRVDAVHPILTDATNIYVGSFQAVTPTGGTNPVVKLTPNDYMVTFQDARIPWRISVPASMTVLNALALTSTNSPLPTYVYTPPFLLPTGFTGTVTNLAWPPMGLLMTNQVTDTNTIWWAGQRYPYVWNGSVYFGIAGDYLDSYGNYFDSHSFPAGFFGPLPGAGMTWGTVDVVTTNAVQHFNLTMFTNGVCHTNIFQ